jgi:hypothetical protein
VSSSLIVRPARVEDVAQMARVNVRSRQETYRGLMSDAVLDDPGFLAARDKHGFVADGTAQVEDGVREIRMVRGMQHSR